MRKIKPPPKYGPEAYRNKIENYELSESEKEVRNLIIDSWQNYWSHRAGEWRLYTHSVDFIILVSEIHNCRVTLKHQDYFAISRADMHASEPCIYIKASKDDEFLQDFCLFVHICPGKKDKELQKLISKTLKKINRI